MSVGQAPARPTGLGPRRAVVLDHLRQSATPQSVTDVAAAVGLHPNTARFHLDALTDAGLIVREYEKRERPGRPRLLYRAEAVEPSSESMLQDLAGALIRQLDRTGDHDQAEEAGRTWGAELAATRTSQAPLDRVVSALTELGYQPRVESGPPTTIELTPCPLRALLGDANRVQMDAVCRLHLGLIRGLLADDPDYRVDSLEPLVTASRCVAHLTRRTDG